MSDGSSSDYYGEHSIECFSRILAVPVAAILEFAL
jgi:hypothetical protein